jgi:hypothetical protein
MAEANANATPPATSGGLTEQRVNEMLAAAIKPLSEALTPLGETIKSLADNQKVLADTMAKLPPATTAKNEGEGAGAEKPLTAADVAKLLDDRDKARQTTEAQRAERQRFIDSDTSGLKRLPAEFKDRLGSDPAKWKDEATTIAGSWEKFVKDNKIAVPDVGGGAGGEAPAGGKAADGKAAQLANSGALPDGMAKFAAEVDGQLSGRPVNVPGVATATAATAAVA